MLYAIVAVIALIIDQAVKYWTTVNIVVDTGEAKFIPGFIHLANVHNTGAAFSFLQGARWFFVILCVIFVLIVVYSLAKDIIRNRLSRWMAVFVMAGAIGNCIDRIVCGYVVDMFEFDFLIFKHRFPVFNVADIYITLGVVIFCICILLEKPRAPKEKKSSQTAVANSSATPDFIEPSKKKHSLQSNRQQKERTSTVVQKNEPLAPTPISSDPFAEWEQKAMQSAVSTIASTPTVEPTTAEIESNTTVVAPVSSASSIEKAEEINTFQKGNSVVPNSTAASSKDDTSDSYNLDDILAEFRDL